MTAHLHDFYRSSAAYRVRIVVNLKGLRPSALYVNLTKGFEQRSGVPEVQPVRPDAGVPARRQYLLSVFGDHRLSGCEVA